MSNAMTNVAAAVNCRIGSLEIVRFCKSVYNTVNCRIGSLEIFCLLDEARCRVNCRIGSLEKKGIRILFKGAS